MNEQQLQQAYTRHCETTGQTKTTRTGFEDFKAGFRLGQPAAGEPVAKYRERSNHHVIRQDESLPCYCWAESDHRIGQEVAAPPAAAHVADGEQAEPGEVGRAEFEAECRKQHRDITRNDVRGFEWGYLNHLTHDRWCGFNMAVRCMGLDRAPPAAAHGDDFQARVQPWMLECFGEAIAGDREERNHRFLEEALELVQSTGCTASEAHQLVDYVYGRPVGEPSQEVGGVMVTLAALCLANNDLDMRREGYRELARVWTKVEAIRAKQAAKPKHSPLPERTAQEQEHELIGYMAPVALMDLLHGGDTIATIRSAIPSLVHPTPTPPEDWAVPIYVVRRLGEPQ